ncbi:hypothetical protein EE36_12813 [Sulfitobacter sp. EE-36]|jgi:hypothetical protein|nr:hypothetical protein EE36_12813 [Sulfitobacter sp. EE-36]
MTENDGTARSISALWSVINFCKQLSDISDELTTLLEEDKPHAAELLMERAVRLGVRVTETAADFRRSDFPEFPSSAS